MAFGMIGKKKGMTQLFQEDGTCVPVTVIECGPCTVVNKLSKEKNGYNALQLGFSEIDKPQRVNKPAKGHFQKAKTPIFRHLAEYRLEDIDTVEVGDIIKVSQFQVGDVLNARGKTIGRGFQGVIKRHNHAGGAASHGSHFHRAPGSIGMCASPAKVIKGVKLPGQMGNEYRTIKNLKVIEIDVEKNLLFVKGSVPGSRGSIIRLIHTKAALSDRFVKKTDSEAEAQPKAEEAPATEAQAEA